MRLIVCNKYHFIKGGAERYFFNLMRLLDEAGHQTTPFSVAFPGSEPSEFSRFFAAPPSRSGGVHFREFRMSAREKVRGVCNSVYSFNARHQLQRLIEARRPDAGLLLNTVNYVSPSVIDAFDKAGLPVVMRFSDYNFVCARHSFFREGKLCFDCKDSKWSAIKHRCVHSSAFATTGRVFSMWVHERLGLYDKVAHFVAPSRMMARELKDFGVPEDRISFIPTPVDTSKIQPSYESDPFILFFGRISSEKGVRELLQAFHQLPKNSGYHLRLIGSIDDDYLPEIRTLMNHPGVQYFPPLATEELWRHLSRARIVVVPSLSPDNSPNVVYEAFAARKPVVGSRIGGIPDQIGDDAGILVDPGDIDGLSAAMNELLGDKARRERMARAARARAETEFSPERHLSKLLSVFRSIGVS